MSLYPSLEDMKVDNMVRAQMAQQQHQAPPSYPGYPHPPVAAAAAPASASALRHVYPALGDYMGLELSQDVIAANMPEYQIQTVSILRTYRKQKNRMASNVKLQLLTVLQL